MSDRARIDYKGLPEHGKTLPVIGRREFHGIAMVVLDNDGIRLALPVDRVTIICADAGKEAA
jgi:hypothetical protein